MAKRKQPESEQPKNGNVPMRINKSAKIRQLLQERGMDASPSEIARELTGQGLAVTPANVSQVKLQLKKGKGRGSRGGRKPAAVAPATFEPAARTKAADGTIAIDDVQTVKALVNRMGAASLIRLVEIMG